MGGGGGGGGGNGGGGQSQFKRKSKDRSHRSAFIDEFLIRDFILHIYTHAFVIIS